MPNFVSSDDALMLAVLLGSIAAAGILIDRLSEALETCRQRRKR